jgi:hypothetical protein
MIMRHPVVTSENERGSAFVEFAFSTLVWVPLLLGLIGIGTELIREIEVTQVCRDAAHMSAYGVDFTQSSSQQLILQAAPSTLGLAQTGGNGAIILSTIRMISEADCQSGNLSDQACTNLNQAVFQSQIVIGNSQSYQSSFGTPNASTVSQSTMLTSPSERVPLILQFLPSMTAGQTAYVGEVFLNNSDLAWTGIGGSVIASQSIF